METSLSVTLNGLGSTEAFGKTLGRFMNRGQVIALIGELGAGKTTLVKAIAAGLGVPREIIVSSPSYTLVNEYDGRIPLFHFDLYRLEGAGDLHELGYDEYLEGRGVTVIEWADVAPEILPGEYLELKLEISGESERRLSMKGFGKGYERIVGRMRGSQEGLPA